MTSDGRPPLTRQYFRVFEDYVLSPPDSALSTIERERAELKAERDAFEAFRDRIRGLGDPDRTRHSPAMTDGGDSDEMAAVRAAYRQTVMSTSHYNDVYDNTLLEDIESEFGERIAEAIQPETTLACTDQFRQFLSTAASKSASNREKAIDRLGDEKTSIASARDELAELVATVDGARVPEWYATEFEARLDTLAAERQDMLRSQRSPRRLDSHSLCQYLYDDMKWTYPVLTAVGRLREAVVLEHAE